MAVGAELVHSPPVLQKEPDAAPPSPRLGLRIGGRPSLPPFLPFTWSGDPTVEGRVPWNGGNSGRFSAL